MAAQTTFEKPRRLDEETADYLKQVESQWKGDMTEEDREILIANVLTEIKTRTASALSDRNTNIFLEKICTECSLKYLVDVINRCIPYAVFLARDRYGSHVLQTIVSRLCSIIKFEGFGDCDEEEVKENILNFSRPILEQLAWLSGDINASHVTRAIICLLAGMPVISQKKGKGSKHQHSVAFSKPLDILLDPIKFYVQSAHCFTVPDEFHDLLIDSMEALLKMPAKDIQSMLANASSSAVIGLLVRILCNPDIIESSRGSNGPSLAASLYKLSLEWNASSDNHEDTAALFYAMAGDRSGSYFLEAVMECGDVEFLCSLLSCSIKGKAMEYAMDGCGNFVLQSALKRFKTLIETDAIKDNSLLKKVNSLLKVLLDELSRVENIKKLVAARGGVLMWLLSIAKLQPSTERESDLGKAILNGWIESGSVSKTESSEDSSGTKEDKLSIVFTATFVAPVKTSDPTEIKGVDLSSQILLARMIAALMTCRDRTVAESVAKAFSRLPTDNIRYLSTTGQISRVILDPFFDSYKDTNEFKAFTVGFLKVISEIAGHIAGQHVFRKAYESADLRGKERFVLALTSQEVFSKLNTSKEGKASLEFVNAELYRRDVSEWRSNLKKQIKAEKLMSDFQVKPKVDILEAQTVDGIEIDLEEQENDATADGGDAQVKKTRKRKRKRANAEENEN